MPTPNEVSRTKSLELYYQSPNHCSFCHSIIRVRPNEKVSQMRMKKFCNSSCFAFYANKTRVRVKKQKICASCSYPILRGHYCAPCLALIKRRGKPPIGDRTKSELFSSRKNWQSARGAIVKHAIAVYRETNAPFRCAVCGYAKHVQIAHKKAVSAFPGTALIREINHPDNLAPLCPNHHWEQENELLVLP